MCEKYADQDLMVLGVNAWDESKAVVSRFVKEQGLRHRILLNGSEAAKRYEVTGVPTVLWIDRDGNVTDAELGFKGPEELQRRTEALLKRGPK